MLCEPKIHMQLPLVGWEEPAEVVRRRPGKKPLVDETELSEDVRERIRSLQKRRDKLPSGRKYRQMRNNIGASIWKLRHPEKAHSPERLAAIDRSRKRWLSENREKRKKIALEWYYRNRPPLRNKEFALTIRASYVRRRRQQNVNYAVADRLRATTNRAFRRNWMKKPAQTEKLLGCTIEDAKSHIESQFVDGMSWTNRRSFVIDHIIPVVAFNLLDPEEVLLAFNWKNLQPLTPHDNATKSDAIPHPLPSWLPSHIAERINSRRPKHLPVVSTSSSVHSSEGSCLGTD